MPTVELTARAVLDLWDRGQDPGLTDPDRALLLAGAAGDEVDPGSLAVLPVGRVTALLLRLRADLAGTAVAALVGCPACGLEVEFEADTDELLDLEAKIDDAPPPVLVGEHAITWRPPSYGDLAALSHSSDPDPRGFLAGRCVLEVRHGDEKAAREPLPATLLDSLSDAMATADPLAEVLLDLVCPDCGHAFRTALDFGSFVWSELESRAQRLVLEVDALARSYGWTEQQVLALSDVRRAHYLRLVTEEPA
jgi:hypothetical protein